ncbi:MAG: DUF3048 domain-containing protein [Chloroflexi bacterium]|nr:MAG: DUF3048 domain-containing protein [Chloroflexota bacterium]
MPIRASLTLALTRFWPPRWWQAAIAAAAVVALGAGGWMVLNGLGAPAATVSPSQTQSAGASSSGSPSATPSPSEPPPVAVCPLNGIPLGSNGPLSPVALAVQIDNHPAARPGRNLSRADMVIEATVEGDTTRFTAIFLCQPTLGLTGPVRSARYYTLDVWRDLHVLPYFFGGATKAMTLFHDAHMPYVNGIKGGWPWFSRFGSHPAPHDLYADIEATRGAFGTSAQLDGLAGRVGNLCQQFDFVRNVQVPTGRSISSVQIQTNGYWRFAWSWDLISGLWRRSDAGVPISDEATGRPVTARCVVVQKVVETIDYSSLDPGGSPRRVHQLVGSGTGTLYVNGHAIDLVWSRPTGQDGTRWTYAATGKRVVLPIGVYWWEIIPTYAVVTEH